MKTWEENFIFATFLPTILLSFFLILPVLFARTNQFSINQYLNAVPYGPAEHGVVFVGGGVFTKKYCCCWRCCLAAAD